MDIHSSYVKTGWGHYGPGHQSDVVIDRIRALAHRKWEEAGRPEGRDLEFWIQAETEIVDQISLR